MFKYCLMLVASVICPASFAVSGVIESYVPNAREVGSGEYKVLLFKVFNATTFAPQGRLDFNQPFALQLTYYRDIKGEAIVNKTIEEIGHQTDKVPEAKLKQWQNELVKIIPPVTKGTILTGIYTEKQQTLFFDGNWNLLGKIDGQQFAEHFFGIWLGPDSSNPQLRDKLTGFNRQ